MIMKMMKIVLMSLMLFFSLTAHAETVDINKADVQTLSSQLSGIGEKKAQAIVDYRKINGEFRSVDELSRVKGISGKTIEKNRDKLIVNNIKS